MPAASLLWEMILGIAVCFYACKDKYTRHKQSVTEYGQISNLLKLCHSPYAALKNTVSFTNENYYAMGLSLQQPQEQRLRPSV